LHSGKIDGVRASSDTTWIEQRAKALGFDLCGVVRAVKFPELLRTEEWLARGYAGEMKYLADRRRRDPEAAMAGIRSVIVCALNYNTDWPRSTEVMGGDRRGEASSDRPSRASREGEDSPRGWISRYAWGSDYHNVLRKKLDALVASMRERFADEPFEARAYADTGPIQERVLAKYAGLGWLGKNTLLLNQALGSWFFLGTILTTLDLPPSLRDTESPPPDLCGSCQRCIDACPTDALVEPYVMDARRCISYLTIELRGSIPEELREPMEQHVFGCDICQDVCPWNRRAPATSEPEFQPRSVPAKTAIAETDVEPSGEPAEDSLFLPRLEWLASMSEEEYRQVFRGSPIKRTKWPGLVRNACIALGNSQSEGDSVARGRIAALLQRLAASPDAAISESALWALSRIQ
jgi:epoxyqueuosine reductase